MKKKNKLSNQPKKKIDTKESNKTVELFAKIDKAIEGIVKTVKG